MSFGYDTSCSTLSPEGKSYQVEYAKKAVEDDSSVVGLVCKDGVVLIREKYVASIANVPGSNPTIYSVNKHIGICFGGRYPDGRALVKKARENAASFYENFGIPIKGTLLTDQLAINVTTTTLTWYERPFGSVSLISSFDDGRYRLHMIDVDGSTNEYYACSHGKGRIFIKAEIERDNFAIKDLPIEEAAVKLMKILIKSYEGTEKLEYDISVLSEGTNKVHKKLSYQEVELIRSQANELIQQENDEMN